MSRSRRLVEAPESPGGPGSLEPVVLDGVPPHAGSSDATGASGIGCSVTVPARIEVSRAPCARDERTGPTRQDDSEQDTEGVDR